VSFLERAKQAAAQAAEQAKVAAAQAGHAASEMATRTSATLQDPATAEKARQTLSRAKRGLATAVDRIDPAVLADVIIKATALQERANAALRTKGSPYRISQIEIGASIPPSISFAISRLDDPDLPAALDSTDLAGQLASGEGTITALDGTTIDEHELLESEPA
jgi:hypothetical protein